MQEEKKVIDFDQLRKQYSNMTEFNLPFTAQHIEDVIFVQKKEIITLESIFYNRSDDSKYSKLK